MKSSRSLVILSLLLEQMIQDKILKTVKNKCRFYTRIVNELLNKDNNETNPK